MRRILIVTSVLLIAAAVWILQARKVDTLRGKVERLRVEAGGRTVPGSANNTDYGAPSAKSPRRPMVAPGGKAQPPQPVEARNEEPRGSESDGDLLRAQQLADRLALAETRRKKLLPLLIRYAESERAATNQLLEQAAKYLGGDYANGDGDFGDLHSALRQRAGIRGQAADLRELLSASELKVLEEFDATREGNALQLLADREYELWNSHLDLAADEQAAYNAFYRLWQIRLEEPLEEGFTSAELEQRLLEERRATLERFSRSLSDQDLKLMQTLMEAGHRLIILRGQEDQE